MPGPTWILVADAARARILDFSTPPNLLQEFEHPESRLKGSEIMADDRGRAQSKGAVHQRGAATDFATPPSEVESVRFAKQLAEVLRLALARQEFEQVILVADPTFLGQLRGAIDTPVTRAVQVSIAKDYTHHRVEEVLAHVRSVIAAAS